MQIVCVLSRFDTNNKSGFSEGDFVDDRVSKKNLLRRSGRFRNQEKVLDVKTSAYKPV